MPKLEDVENTHLDLLEIGNEAVESAKWHEKIEPFEALQKRSISATIELESNTTAPAEPKADSTDRDRLRQILDRMSVDDLALDSLGSLPEAPAGVSDTPSAAAEVGAEVGAAAATPAAAPLPDYDDALLSQALDNLSAGLKNEIIKILEDPARRSPFGLRAYQ